MMLRKISLGFAIACSLPAILFARAERGTSHPVISDPAGLLFVVRAKNEPVEVVQMTYQAPFSLPADKHARLRNVKVPNLNVQVVNRSNRDVSYIEYTLDPPDRCPGSDHPFSTVVWYGRTQPTAGALLNLAEPPIAPGQSVQIVVKGADLQGIRAAAVRAKCGPDDRIDFTIWKVAFADGTGWQAFADGPDHMEWNGRPWTPPAPGSWETPAADAKP